MHIIYLSRKWQNDFKNPSSKQDNYYDLVDDYELIESSFLKQYGIRLRSDELEADEFLSLLGGLMGDTPLGSIIQIRSEKDSEVIKNFTPEQKKIHNEWAKKQALSMNMDEYNQAMEGFKNAFISLAK